MARSPAPPVVPWRTTMRERHLPVPRDAAWVAALERLGTDAGDLSVEPPWRHVRRLRVPYVERVEQALTIRDDGAECHLAWCVGLTAEADDPAADALLTRLGTEGETLLDEVAGAVAS
jgi:hypothetical protein